MKMISLIMMWILINTPGTGDPEIMGVDDLRQWVNEPAYPVVEIPIEEEDVVEQLDYSICDEMGQVPILVYHRIKDTGAEYDISAADFRKNLETLYENDFVPIDLVEYLQGKIDTPYGKHPVAITFDDGTRSQFNLIESESGEEMLDPGSAMGILYEFYLEHPDFGFEATFFLNGHAPFGDKETAVKKLEFMLKNGIRIGNHTLNHENFSLMGSNEAVIAAVMDNEVFFKETYGLDMEQLIALPFGAYPKDFAPIEEMGYPSFKVGWKPEVSVFSTDFDPLRINRVQNGKEKFMFEFWIDDLIRNPEKVFTSDGDPETITIPAEKAEKVDGKWFESMSLRIREEN